MECEEDFDDRFDEVDGEELFDSYTAVLADEVTAGLTPISHDKVVHAQALDSDCLQFKRWLETDSSLPFAETDKGVFCRIARRIARSRSSCRNRFANERCCSDIITR